jgi:FlaG/FlaF family flagellin (archaellin)
MTRKSVWSWATAVLVAITFLAPIFVGLAPGVDAASAYPPEIKTTWCNGKSQSSVVKVYLRGTTAVPLRCGTAAWGFNHVKARWNVAYDALIAATVSRGYDDGNVFNWRTCPNFKVFYNPGPLHGTGVRPQGVITAYVSDS